MSVGLLCCKLDSFSFSACGFKKQQAVSGGGGRIGFLCSAVVVISSFMFRSVSTTLPGFAVQQRTTHLLEESTITTASVALDDASPMSFDCGRLEE